MTPNRPSTCDPFQHVALILATGSCGLLLSVVGCGSSGEETVDVENPLTDPEDGPAAGNPDGACAIPAEGGLEDASNPTTVVGEGTPESCTSQAFVDAVAAGGVITFDCGDEPHTIMLEETAKIFNDASDEVIIDGGGSITLSGTGNHRILYMNTCDEAQHWTTSHCNNQDHPRLTVQNITFVDGNARSAPGNELDQSGGAIFASGGRFKAINARFFNNTAAQTGPDVGGGAIRTFQQYEDMPVYLVNCTFGGQDGYGNNASNGGAISSIGVSWRIYNSVFSYNSAVGNGGNPSQAGTPGGGSGGAIYNDGNEMTLSICGSLIEKNQANAFGDAIFFVSNNYSGDVVIQNSTISDNCGTNGAWNPDYPGISNHEVTNVAVENSEISGCASD